MALIGLVDEVDEPDSPAILVWTNPYQGFDPQPYHDFLAI